MHKSIFETIPTCYSFPDVLNQANQAVLPDDWCVIIADIENSTAAVASGRYKDVNIVGAAIIAAITGVDSTITIPYVFGGDGATLVVPETILNDVCAAAASVAAQAEASFGLKLRIGYLDASSTARHAYTFRLAKLRLNNHIDTAIFIGDGWEAATDLLKSGSQTIKYVPADDTQPRADVHKLECRWQKIKSRKGQTLSLIISSNEKELHEQCHSLKQISKYIFDLFSSNGDAAPVADSTLKLALNPYQLVGESKLHSYKHGSLLPHLMQTWLKTVIGKLLMSFKAKAFGVDWGIYRADLLQQTDYCKVHGNLHLLLDCTPEVTQQIINYLEELEHDGVIKYGYHISDGCQMTCVVFDHARQHIHFVDGCDGGYVSASVVLKNKQ